MNSLGKWETWGHRKLGFRLGKVGFDPKNIKIKIKDLIKIKQHTRQKPKKDFKSRQLTINI